MDSDSTIPVFESQYPSHYKFLQVFVNKRHLQIYFLYLKLILPLLVTEISWSKNVAIMEKCKDQLEREFYIKMTKKYGWTKDVLINHRENKSYEK